MVAVLFSTGQHRKGTEAVIQHTVAVSPKADRERMIQGLEFDENGLLVGWKLNKCKISTLPGSFRALVCTGRLNLCYNHLKSLPANFGELEVGGHLYLQYNLLKSLPEGFENISVGGDLELHNNQLAQQSCIFPNVRGDVCFQEPVYDPVYDY